MAKIKNRFHEQFFAIAIAAIAGIALVFLLAGSCAAQNFVYNGNGFFENRTPETDAEMAKLPGRVILAIPGGPISKLVQPVTNPKGWGLDDNFTRDVFAQYPDEDGSSSQKWLDKENTQPNRSFLYDCVDLSNQYPGDFGFIYRFNINSTPAEAVNALSILIDGKCFVYGVVAGSEVYSWLEFDTAAYFSKSQPIIDAIHANWPSLKIALCIAPNPDRKDHNIWNDAMYNYARRHTEINAFDAHLYEGEKSCPDTWAQMPSPRILTPGNGDAELYTYFNNAYNCLSTAHTLQDRITTFKTAYPDLELWCMEGFTTNPSAYFGNTWLGAMAQFKFLVENYNSINVLGKQSGVTPDLYGDFSRANNYDINTGMIKRTGYFATQLGLEAVGAGATPYTDMLQLPLVDVAAFYFFKQESFGGAFLVPEGWEVDSIVVRRLSAPFLFSSSGSMQYMAKGTPKSYELSAITQITYFSSTFFVPANSFGWVEVYQHKIPPPPPPVCKCEDKTATNYGAIVDCADEKPCEYPAPPPPEVCYKERLIFKSIGCKVDKKCQVNNCK
jgi:hypothetical protein